LNTGRTKLAGLARMAAFYLLLSFSLFIKLLYKLLYKKAVLLASDWLKPLSSTLKRLAAF